MGPPRSITVLLAAALAVPLGASTAPAAEADRVPAWAREAVDHLVAKDFLDEETFRPNTGMGRKRFARLMRRAFGYSFEASDGVVTAAEVDDALVAAMGFGDLASSLHALRSPGGWKPAVRETFGNETVARALGLRHDRPVPEDRYEASDTERLTQADIAYAVWRALAGGQTYAAEQLETFALADYDQPRRAVIAYALSLVGTPYVWAGEWPGVTPEGYPYGAQVHGGFDCSGFIWYVLHARSGVYDPVDRTYEGWTLKERSSRDMAAAARKRIRFGRLQPGDLMFFAPEGRASDASTVYHVGMYVGQGWMVHSSGSGAGVNLSYAADGWWRSQFAWGRRIIPATTEI